MSSYLVLARKYRPRTFEEVVGQDATTRILRGALEGGRIGHAYLLAGPRGTGKTTLARIMARCLNCEQGPTPTPCGTCERCRENDAGRETDLIEIDGASNRGIEDVRLLRDEVAYAPMRARYKVYIVDEVHMLTTPAFNALLKTLEEPPRHVVFLFATTELHKVPDTVVSRCQVLRLSPLSEETIAGQLAQVFGREGVEVGPGVTTELARMARGSPGRPARAPRSACSTASSPATAPSSSRSSPARGGTRPSSSRSAWRSCARARSPSTAARKRRS
jgi:DNA polymerase-3 subunit gamma/tau